VALEIEVTGLEWDEENESHCARHGLTPIIAAEVLQGAPRFFRGKTGRTATHAMIGPALDGRWWTVHILETAKPGVWRPITGWPSTGQETALYKKSGRNRNAQTP
jgi:hypothetical protein